MPPVASVNVSTFILVVAGVLVEPVKFKLLNQLPVVNVGTLAPEVNDKLGALVAVPPVVLPKENVLVTDIAVVNPPVPVKVKSVASAMFRTVSPAAVLVNIILPEPNAIERVLEVLELNVPAVKSNPFKFNVPAESVAIDGEPKPVTSEPVNVVVPPGQLTVNSLIDIPFGVITPVPTITTNRL